MDQSVINELLGRIKSLEEKNEKLRAEIKQKKTELESTDFEEKIMSLNDEKMDVDIEELNTNELPPLYSSLQLEQGAIMNNVGEQTIQYIPNEQIAIVYIMGDFTNWEMKPMNKHKGIFSYTVILLKNYRYYFSLSYDGQITIDMNQFFEKNPRNNQIANFIDVFSEDNIAEITPFDYQKNNPLLEIQKKNYMMIKAGNWQEVYYLEQLTKYAQGYHKEYDSITSNYHFHINLIEKNYQNKLNEDLPINKVKLLQILQVFIGRIFIRNDKQYEIINIMDNLGSFSCFGLYDQNHIKQNKVYYTQNALFYPFPVSDITKGDNRILSKEESDKILLEYTNNKEDVIKVFYKDKNIPVADNTHSYRYYSSMLTMLPSKVEPSRINLNDYIYDVSAGTIIQVRNKIDSCYVQFVAEQIKKDGKPSEASIYYSQHGNNINIVHMHFKDQELFSKVIETKYLEHSFDYHTIKAQSAENASQNKIMLLCKGFKPFKVYSNGKRIPFDSVHLKCDSLYQIKSDSMESSFNNFYVKITTIPVVMLIKVITKENPKHSFLNHLNLRRSKINPLPLNYLNEVMEDENIDSDSMQIDYIDRVDDQPKELKQEESQPKEAKEIVQQQGNVIEQQLKETQKTMENTMNDLQQQGNVLEQKVNDIGKIMNNIQQQAEEIKEVKEIQPQSQPIEEEQNLADFLNKYDIIENCTHPYSNGGNIDALIVYDEGKGPVNDELGFAFPPCVFRAIEPQEEAALKDRKANQKYPSPSYEMSMYESINNDLKNYAQYVSNETAIKELSKDDIKQKLSALKTHDTSIQGIMSYIEQNELWEKLDEISQLSMSVNEYITLFSQYQ